MKASIFLIAMILLGGLASAGVMADPFYEGALDKVSCMYNVAGAMGQDAGCYGAPGTSTLLNDMKASYLDMMNSADAGDMPSFMAAFQEFISLMNELRMLYLYYGFDSIGPDIILGYFEYQQDIFDCYSGAPPA